MLNIYRTNKIELITEVLAKELLINPPYITEEVYVAVGNKFLSKWMRDQITIRNQISTLYEFKSIPKFTENILNKIFDIDIEGWDYESLKWKIISSLEELKDFKESWPLSIWIDKYIRNNKIVDKDIYVLSTKISKVFSDYLRFRPEIIFNWNNDEEWR